MLNTKPDLVIAFHNNLEESKGTKHIVNVARKRGIDVEIIDENWSRTSYNIYVD